MKNSVTNFLMDFSVLLRMKREKLSFSQFELSSKLGISLRTYQRIECGESEPSLSQVYKLAHILNFDVSEIFHYGQRASEETKLLNQSAHEIEELAKLSRVGSWNLEISTGISYWSKIIKETLDINDDFILDKVSVWHFFKQGYSLELGKSTLNRCINDFIPFKVEVDLITTKGEIRHCFITGIPEIIDNKVVRVYGVFQDNTDCKNLHVDLQNALTKISDIQSFAGFGCWNRNLQSNKSTWSASLYDLFQLDNEINRMASYELFINMIHPEDREIVNKTYQDSLTNKGSSEIEYRIILGNGEIRWILSKYKTEFDSHGKPTYSFGYAQDITKYKKVTKLSF